MLRAESIEKALASAEWTVQAYGSVESTNLIIKEALGAGCSEGLVATALIQGGGYGRQGRLWKSPLGGLYFSFALKPLHRLQGVCTEHISTLSLVIALALRQAFEELGIGGIQIKWPNDVLLGGAKVCGISLEGVSGGICVGIGINVFPTSENPQEISTSYQAAYVGPLLAEVFQQPAHEGFVSQDAQRLSCFQGEMLERILAAVLNAFGPLYEAWLQRGFMPFCEEYNARLFNVGKPVVLTTIAHHALLEGVVEGVDERGRLLLRQKEGSIVAASSGEVHTLGA